MSTADMAIKAYEKLAKHASDNGFVLDGAGGVLTILPRPTRERHMTTKHPARIQAFGHEYPATAWIKDGRKKASVRWFTHGGKREQNRDVLWTRDQVAYDKTLGLVLILDTDVQATA